MAIGNWCYGQLNAGVTLKNYTYTSGATGFTTQGAWRRFDQTVFTTGLGMGNLDKLMQWGYYYVPTACQTTASKCQL